MRLNQINWNCELYAHTATVTGRHRSCSSTTTGRRSSASPTGIRRRATPRGSPNLGRATASTTSRNADPWHPYNLDSAEYASETCHFIMYYEAALRAGHAPVAPEHMTLLRAWIEHIVYGYWTHGGYLNWDTGYGFKRWHAGRTWALAQQGLLAIATSPRFHNVTDLGAWAKYLFDRGLAAVRAALGRGAGRARNRPGEPLRRRRRAARPEHPRDVRGAHAGQCRAGRRAGPGGPARDREPPPLYSFDGDIGRLAITTPAYNTAVLAVNQRAVPYGGIELARLYDGDQRVVANVGGRPLAELRRCWSATPPRRRSCSRSEPRNEPPPKPPLELLASPRGRVRRAKPYPRRPYGGTVRDDRRARPRGFPGGRGRDDAPLQARPDRDDAGRSRAPPRRGSRSTCCSRPGDARRRDRGGARRRAAGDAGREGRPRRARCRLRNVAYFYVAGEETGYVVIPSGAAPAGGRAHPAAQGAVVGPEARPDTRAAARRPAEVQASRGRGQDRTRRRPDPGIRDRAAASRLEAGPPAAETLVRRRAGSPGSMEKSWW